jgi:DNA-binding transcriptional regulator YhcF (GntR family)
MFIRVETSSGVPITRQIADQIRSHSVSGALAPGDRLPSVRQLAKELAVNQNTILHVYERLTAEGLLERRQGDGTYLSRSLPRGRARAQREMLAQEMDRLAHRVADLGVSAEEAHELLDEALARTDKQRASVRKGRGA